MWFWYVLMGISFLFFIIRFIISIKNHFSRKPKTIKIYPYELDKLQADKELLKKRENELQQKEATYKQKIFDELKNYESNLFQEKSKSQKWLASMIADIEVLPIDNNIQYLWHSYSYTKRDKAIKMTELRNQIQHLIEQNKMLEYEIKYLYQLYPKLEDKEIELDYEAIPEDPLEETGWLTKEEWENLSSIEKNTLAYERYKQRHKTKWQIGRDFEMFIGYQYENGKYEVIYNGIEKKYEDEGIDLIAKKKKETLIIQCKYWSTKKTIHENHLCQLYGTAIKYKLDHPEENVIPIFICHNELSPVAKQFANKLGIEFSENVQLGEYPAIKCHDDTMIYHLPFDLNYDTIKHCHKVMTVEQAEKEGFRRAFKWHNSDN